MTPTRDNARLLGPGAVVSKALAGGAYCPDSTTRPAGVQVAAFTVTGGRP